MLEKFLVRDTTDSGWMVFTDAVDVLQTRSSEDVLATLSEVERRVNEENLFAAGYLCYEAASGFDSAYVTRESNHLPLICFGLFSSVQRCEVLNRHNVASENSATWKMVGSRSSYVEKLLAIKRQIELGNTYQVNYTVRQSARNITEPWELFLRIAADAPYAAYVECENHAIVSASPELFFQLNDRQLISRPMKGTAMRGLTSVDDLAMRQELYESRKNRAENVMVTDMVRNDLGRIASPGSVTVPTLFEIEKYPTVWQMTSTVSAETDAHVSEIFQALFPCASITGAPKVSSMKLIAELEDAPREIYTGAIGYFGPNRQAQFNVAIRTALIDKKTNEAVYGVGGGIVWDSDPDEEYRECLTKAKILSSTNSTEDFELLETLLLVPESGFFLLDEHLDRMQASAAYFDFAFDRKMILGALSDLQGHLPAQRYRIRLLLQRDGRVRITETPFLLDDGPALQRIRLASEPINIDTPFIYHKTTRRDVYERALNTAEDGEDVLLWNKDGFITETSIANIIVSIDGDLCTPPVECGLLAGTYRDRLLRRGEIKERKIHVSELTPATELTLMNSVRGQYSAKLCSTTIEDYYSNRHEPIGRSRIAP